MADERRMRMLGLDRIEAARCRGNDDVGPKIRSASDRRSLDELPSSMRSMETLNADSEVV